MGKLVILTDIELDAKISSMAFLEKEYPTEHSIEGIFERCFEDLCNIHTWEQNIDKVHRFYNDRRTRLGAIEPDAAHLQIAQWEAIYQTTIFTENDDDLLERAGCKEVHHLHGCLTQMRCKGCGNYWSIGYAEWTETDRCSNEKCPSPKRVQPHATFLDVAPRVGPPLPDPKDADTLFHDTIEALQSEDVLLVMGAWHSPINIARLAKCTRILTRLEEGGDLYDGERQSKIDTKTFHHVFYESPVQAIPKIDTVLKEVLGTSEPHR